MRRGRACSSGRTSCFACATYPEEPPYPRLVEAEARHQVARLSAAPVASSSGAAATRTSSRYESWGWKDGCRPGQTWGRRYFLELLPAHRGRARSDASVLARQPVVRRDPDRHPQDPDHGDRHTWDDADRGLPRSRAAFRERVRPPGAAEPGDACAARPDATDLVRRLRGAAAPAAGRSAATRRQYDEPLGRVVLAGPATFDAWHYLAQLLQARAIAIGIEWRRAHRPRCMGALFWQLNDCWTGHSLVGDRRRGPPQAAVVRGAPRVRPAAPHDPSAGDGAPTLFAVNDTDAPWSEDGGSRGACGFDGTVRRDGEPVPLRVSGDGSGARGGPRRRVLGRPTTRRRELLVVDAGGKRARWFFAATSSSLPPPPRGAPRPRSTRRRRRASRSPPTPCCATSSFAVDRLDPGRGIDEQLVTLLPGETRCFRVTAAGDLERARPRRRCSGARTVHATTVTLAAVLVRRRHQPHGEGDDLEGAAARARRASRGRVVRHAVVGDRPPRADRPARRRDGQGPVDRRSRPDRRGSPRGAR